MDRPQVQYVRVSEADVAFQVFGDGPLDLLYFHGLGSHFEHFWDLPMYAQLLGRLADFSRVIIFDRRGTGGSDGVPAAIPTWEEWAEDIRAVLDAAGSNRTAIVAAGDAGPIAILFAATNPGRVSALVLFNSSSRYLIADDYPIGMRPETVDAFIDRVRTTWGTPEWVRTSNPDMGSDAEFSLSLARMFRSAATPAAAAAQFDYILRSLDVREALPVLQVPTLVLHVQAVPRPPKEQARYLAEHITGAKLVELAGRDFAMVAHSEAALDEIAEFLTGERPQVEIERILTTILFTDIVGSTERAFSLGDQRWRSLLDEHDRRIRSEVRRFRGQEIQTTGDGFVATFDGPARAIRCARAVGDATRKLGIDLHMGLHTGECEVRGGVLGGLAIHAAARLCALAVAGEVLVSGTVKDLVVGSGIEFSERGDHQLKGFPGTWRLFAVAT
jgi:class 3 adenylate cyclase/alpha-beta hydrolase superfamily lysophospholipase